MMSEAALVLDEIFVGREQELRILNHLWKKILKPGEHHVYVLLNVPGTGKTRLLLHFGEHLERQHQGVFFHYRCSSRYQTPRELNLDLLAELHSMLESKQEYLLACIANQPRDLRWELKQERLMGLIKTMNDLIISKNVSLNDIVETFKVLARIVPVLLVADEIQEFQKITLKKASEKSINSADHYPLQDETALHYFTRILKDLMQAPILMVLSGTQYHILSQIGTKIGSPIAQKVEQLVIRNFTARELEHYVDQVHDRILQHLPAEDVNDSLVDLVAHYRWFLQAFSGGHPRTVVFITQQLLAGLSTLLQKSHRRESFVDALFSMVETDFKTRIFTREKRAHVQELQAREGFSIVKKWLLTGATMGLMLGPEPTLHSGMQRERVEDLVYQLMTLGVIVRNGLNQYHVTSYFHLLAFLECFTSEHELFLHQVLTNRFFKLLCGSHAGLGYTFEHVLLSSLLLKSYRIRELRHGQLASRPNFINAGDDLLLPLSLDDITAVTELSGDVDWSHLSLVPGTLYHVPQARALDLFVLAADGQRLVLIQVTTTASPQAQNRKLTQLARMVMDVRKIKRAEAMEVIGWFISLFPIPRSLHGPEGDQECVFVTAGSDLEPILGQDLLERLMTVKKHWSF